MVIFLLLSSLGANAASRWRAPHGIFIAGGTTNDYGTNPIADGGRIQVYWSDVETSEGVLDFTAVDARITANDGFGKQFVFVMVMLDVAPSWLLAKPGVTTYSVDFQGSPVSIVLPWNATVLPYLLDYIGQFCRHVDGKIDGIEIGGLGIETETYFPAPTDTTPNIPLTLSAEIAAWTASSNDILDAYAANLHYAPFIMAGGVPFGGGSEGQAAITAVFDHGRNYGPHFGIMQWGLSATSNTGYLINGWVHDYSARHPAGFQFNGNSAGTSGGPLNGTMQAVLANGAALNAQWQEIYPVDADIPAYLGICRYTAGKMASTPAGQLGPMRSRRILSLRKRI